MREVKTLGDILQRSCTGKVLHKTRESAEREAACLGQAWRVSFVPYWCPACPGYHVGHQTDNRPMWMRKTSH